MAVENIGMCFVCGMENQQGLRLSFHLDRKKKAISTLFQPQDWHQGYGSIVHGGIIAILLDEVMVKLVYELGEVAATAQLEVRFKNFLPITENLLVTGKIEKETKRIIYARAEANLVDGTPVAEATGKLMRNWRPQIRNL